MKISIPNHKTIQWMSLGLVIASLVSCAAVTPTSITSGPSTSKPIPEIV